MQAEPFEVRFGPPSLSLWQVTTEASSRMHVTPSSTLSATRMPGRALCRAAMPAQARRRAAFTAVVILPSARSPPRAISSSIRHAVGTEATLVLAALGSM